MKIGNPWSETCNLKFLLLQLPSQMRCPKHRQLPGRTGLLAAVESGLRLFICEMASILPCLARRRLPTCPITRRLNVLSESIWNTAKLEVSAVTLAEPINQAEVAKILYKPIHPWQTRLLCLRPRSFRRAFALPVAHSRYDPIRRCCHE